MYGTDDFRTKRLDLSHLVDERRGKSNLSPEQWKIIRDTKMRIDASDNLRANSVIPDHLGRPIHSCTCGQPCTHTFRIY
jgi:hypothetical protein